MHRTVVVTVALTALVAGVSLGWMDVREERDFRRLIAAGNGAAAAGRYGEAIEAFSGAIGVKPDSMLAHLRRGDVYRRRGDLDAAVRDLTRATRLDPTAPQPIEQLADVYAASGRYDQAAELYNRYLALDDRAAPVLYKLGLAHYRAARFDAAAETLRTAIALDGKLAHPHYALGMTHRAAGRVDAAVTALLRALELDPTFAPAREELAELFAEVGRRTDGIEQLEALAALEPDRPDRLVAVGLAYTRLERHEAAILTLNRAAERHPGAAVVQVGLGEAWLAMAQSGTDVDTVAVRRAIAALQPLAREPAATSRTLTLYGKALLLNGDAAAAETALRQAAERLPVDPDALRLLADAATVRGHHAVADEALTRLARLSP